MEKLTIKHLKIIFLKVDLKSSLKLTYLINYFLKKKMVTSVFKNFE